MGTIELGTPTEALWRLFLFTDGEIAGQRIEKRPQPTEQPHSGLYPDSREEAHTFTGKILTEGDCYTPSDKALTIRIKVTL